MGVLGNKVINYNVYHKVEKKLSKVDDTTSYKRPSFEYLTDSMKGAGIMGEIDFPAFAQFGAMSVEIALKRTNPKVVAMLTPGVHELEIRWAIDEMDTATGQTRTIANKDILRVLTKSLDTGSIEPNAANENKYAAEVLYINHIQNGRSLFEIDKLNYSYKINGKDYAARIRGAL